MKHKLLLITFMVFYTLTLQAQKISLGIINGTNISNINSKTAIGKWKTKPGVFSGIFFEYNANKVVAINAQINYLHLYYEYETYYNYYFWDTNPNLVDILPWYQNFKKDLSYLRIPILFKFQSPTRLSFNFSMGVFYAILLNKQENDDIEIPKDDYGLIFSSGFSYNLHNTLNLSFGVNYASGIKDLFYESKNRDLEFSLGIGFYLKSNKQNETFFTQTLPDTLNPRLSINYSVGTNISQNFGTNKNLYGNGFGYTASASLITETKQNTSFQIGIIYERKSYTLNDSSSLNFYFKPNNNNWWVDSKTDVDYVTVPLLMNIFWGKKQRIYINLGLYAAFRINAKVVGTAENIIRNEHIYTANEKHIYDQISNEFTSMDVGWIVGTGYKLPIVKKYYLDFSLQYVSSFINIYKNATTSDNTIRLRSLSLSVGFQIPIL